MAPRRRGNPRARAALASRGLRPASRVKDDRLDLLDVFRGVHAIAAEIPWGCRDDAGPLEASQPFPRAVELLPRNLSRASASNRNCHSASRVIVCICGKTTTGGIYGLLP